MINEPSEIIETIAIRNLLDKFVVVHASMLSLISVSLCSSDIPEPSRYSSKYSHANEVDGGRLMQLGSAGGEAADDASIPAIHKSKIKNNHMLPNGDAGRTPIRIPVPPVTRDGLVSRPCVFPKFHNNLSMKGMLPGP